MFDLLNDQIRHGNPSRDGLFLGISHTPQPKVVNPIYPCTFSF